MGVGGSLGCKELSSLVIEFTEADINNCAFATAKAQTQFMNLIAQNAISSSMDYVWEKCGGSGGNSKNIDYSQNLRFVNSVNKDGQAVVTAFIDIVETNSATGTNTTVGSYELYSVTKTSDYHYIFKNAEINQDKTDAAAATTTDTQ